MKKHLSLMLVILSLCVFACQTGEKAETAEESKGIEFQKLSLEDAIAQAKAQNKLIMIDFFSPG
jgi:thiol:disulfide interchange protein